MATTSIVIDVPVKGSDEVVTIDCSELPSDPKDFCAVLSAEEADSKYWIKLAYEYRHISLLDQAITILLEGLKCRSIQRQSSRGFELHSLLASLYVQKSREAATGMGRQIDGSKEETKDFWQKRALESIDQASRLRPSSTSTTISRGILSLLSADKDRIFDEANKHFEAVLKENPQNIFAILGKARVLYSRKNFKSALACYQKALRLRPSIFPDPRVGIGLCYWQLEMKDDALAAWERSVEVSRSLVATVLLGLYWLTNAFENVINEGRFEESYAKGLKLISDAYKVQSLPIAGIALASYMFSRKRMDALNRTLQKVLVTAEVPGLRADALFWLGRGQHLTESYDQANAFYSLAKQTEPDSLVASIAIGQMQVVRQDFTDAKLSFESILEKQPKCIEALSVLGSIYTQEALDSSFKGDKKTIRIKAKACLDKAISLTIESKQRSLADPTLHFTRAMLLEDETATVKLKILEQAADIQAEGGSATSPEVLNNMAVVHQSEGNFEVARELYQKAIEGCIAHMAGESSVDFDAQIATITYNLGRCEEQSGQFAAAREIFAGLVQRYPDYIEPAARLAYIAYSQSRDESVLDTVKNLVDVDNNNIEVRALYGWLLSQQKKTKASHFNEDPLRKHFNHTLKYVDNYERYSLVSLGNFYIRLARETRADSESGTAERHKHYDMSIKFFERALHYDNKNAYAAQGLGIAFAEHKQYQKAINIFSKVRETLRDESIFINMGHCLCELHQYGRAIENYESALTTFHPDSKDLNLFLCLGRAWLSRGREEKNVQHLKEALKYARLALLMNPENTSNAFNVAFIQFQFADIIRNTPELQRTVRDLEEAAQDLEEAIKTFTSLAEHKQPPYPRADILQRATMGRNTTTKQLERAIQQQKDYELKNSAKVAEARAKREAEQSEKERIQQLARESDLAKQEILISKRKEMQENARSWAEKRRQEEEERASKEIEKAAQKKEKKMRSRKQRAEGDSDDEAALTERAAKRSGTETKKRRATRRRRKLQSDSESEAHGSDSEEDPDLANIKASKKRKLSKKFISEEFVDSEDDLDMVDQVNDSTLVGGQQYANEHMISDQDLGDSQTKQPSQTLDNSGTVPMDSSHAPATNQADVDDSSVLTNGFHEPSGAGPRIDTNGLQMDE